MKINLGIAGRGVICPAGAGLEALRKGVPAETQIASLGRPDDSWPVLRVDPQNAALLRWQREPRLRRASAITYFLVEAAEQALAGIDSAGRAQTGLVVAFSAGCAVYTRRFFEGLLAQGRKTASPALFPETVFNSPVSHVAAVLGLNGAAAALVGDETAWIAALQTASVWLERGRVEQVLVLGAEEFDPLVLDAYWSARWLRRDPIRAALLPGEGAAGLLVRRADAGDRAVIAEARDGFIYRSRSTAETAAHRMLKEVDPSLPVYRTAARNWFAPIEEIATRGRPTLPEAAPAYLGEAFTASAAWNTLRALEELGAETPALALPIWGLNHQAGRLELRLARDVASARD